MRFNGKYLNKVNPFILFGLFLILCISFLTIGFSAFKAALEVNDIVATIRADADIRVTGISVSNVVGLASTSNNNYNVTSISSNLSLPNSNSAATYQIEITNVGNVEMGILNITGLPNNLTYTINNYTLKNKLCDDTDVSNCKLHSKSTIELTIGYNDNGYDANNTNYDIDLHFDFKAAYNISYVNFANSSNYPTNILATDTLNLTIDTGIDNVTVTNANGVYNSTNHNLTISNATGDVTVTAVINSSNTIHGAYDKTYLSTVADGTYIYDEVAGLPQVTIENGKITSFEYTDTGSGVVFNSASNSIDTGVLAFDGSGFEINMVYTMDSADNAGNYIVTALTAPSKNKYSGFLFRCYSSSRFYLNGTSQGSTSNLNNIPRITDGFRTNTGDITYTFYFRYDPTTSGGPTITISQTPVSTGSSTYTLQTTNLPTSLDNVSISISGTPASGTVTKFATMTVHEFSVTKIS